MNRMLRCWILGCAILVQAPDAVRAEWQEDPTGRAAVHFLTDVGNSANGDGLGVSIGGDAFTNEHLGLRVNLGYFQLETLRAGSPFAGPYEDDLNALYLNLGPILRLSEGAFSPYMTGGVGFYLTDYDAFYRIVVGGGVFSRVALTGGSLNLGVHGGAGFDVALGDGFGIGAQLDYTTVLSEGHNLELLGVHVGLDYRFDSP